METEVECAVWGTVVSSNRGGVSLSLQTQAPSWLQQGRGIVSPDAGRLETAGWLGCTPVGVTAVVTLLPLSPFPSFILQLMHIYGTCPSDMQVFFKGQELTRSELALVELGIVPNSLLVVKVSQHLETGTLLRYSHLVK